MFTIIALLLKQKAFQILFYLLFSIFRGFDVCSFSVKAIVCERPHLVERAIAAKQTEGPAPVVVVDDVTAALKTETFK
jgi:hypothetical protein